MKSYPAFVLAFFAGVLLSSLSLAQTGPINLDFEDEIDSPRGGWFKPSAITDYQVKRTTSTPHSGKYCVEILSLEDNNPRDFGNVMQYIDAKPYRGKRVTFKAYVRSEAGALGRAQMWFRVDRTNGEMGFFDNMNDRPITSSTWKEYTITGRVDKDARGIAIGCMLIGAGKIYVDNTSFTAEGVMGATAREERRAENDPPVPYEPARALSERGLANLVAFSKLYGYIRYFHPSDEAEAAAWDNLAINGVRAIEGATNDEELAKRLQEFFAPIAPTVKVQVGRSATGAYTLSAPEEAEEVIVWKHHGVGMGGAFSIYSSERERYSLDKVKQEQIADLSQLYRSGGAVHKDLGSNITAAIPIMVYATKDNSLPQHTENARYDTLQAGYTPSGDDRATRLADIVIGWNVFQHFYPYFDVVKTDWQATLVAGLKKAASDLNADAFEYTLKELMGRLYDGHGRANSKGTRDRYHLAPFSTYVKGNTAVINAVLPQATKLVSAGDIIEKINGEDIGIFLDKRRMYNSSSTQQHMDQMLGRNILGGYYDKDTAQLHLRTADGSLKVITIKTVSSPPWPEPKRPAALTELEDGIYYVDLDNIKKPEFSKAVNELAKAKAIIFDMRGYPADDLTMSIEHVIDKPVSSAQWHVPMSLYPDRENVQWNTSSWEVEPKSPRFTSNIVYLTDGRAVSAAETFMGIVEHYKLGEIVGSPTAGTNGNVNPFELPGGYMISWTGMKVLKHDGSQHHGIGIQPTVPCEPTAAGIRAGRDEVLEKGIEVAKKKIRD